MTTGGRAAWALAAVALAVVAGIAAVRLLAPADEVPAPPAQSSAGSEVKAPPPIPRPASTPTDPLAAAEQAVEVARAERREAHSALGDAEAEMEQVERDVEEIERFIEDLEARGEDPVDHAEEGLALLHPTLERYRETATRIEEAQSALRAADRDLASAERALDQLRAGSGAGPGGP